MTETLVKVIVEKAKNCDTGILVDALIRVAGPDPLLGESVRAGISEEIVNALAKAEDPNDMAECFLSVPDESKQLAVARSTHAFVFGRLQAPPHTPKSSNKPSTPSNKSLSPNESDSMPVTPKASSNTPSPPKTPRAPRKFGVKKKPNQESVAASMAIVVSAAKEKKDIAPATASVAGSLKETSFVSSKRF